nr:MAG TPA: hypothetical protein [Caudoviricetes sp.]
MSKCLFFFSGTASSLAWASLHADRYTAFGLLLLVSLILWFLGEYMK